MWAMNRQNEQDKEDVVEPGRPKDERMRHVRREKVLGRFHQAGENQNGDDDGHTEIGKPSAQADISRMAVPPPCRRRS